MKINLQTIFNEEINRDELLVSIRLVKFLLVVHWVKKISLNNSDNSSTSQTNLAC